MPERLTVVCWKWHQPGYAHPYTVHHVNRLRAMVARHYPEPHRFVCVTDDPGGLDPGIKAVPLWSDHADLPNAWRPTGPSCYRRLRVFAADAADLFGPRFVSIDLDAVIVGDLRPLWHRTEDFIIWKAITPGTPYCGSMFMLTAGARPRVWEKFDPIRSRERTKRRRIIGSDQAWIAACLGPNEATWSTHDGVLSFKYDVLKNGGALPAGTRIVFFHGEHKPWYPETWSRAPWIQQHWGPLP